MFKPKHSRHRMVIRALEMLNSKFPHQVHCYFGEGTRIVLALHEFRESVDIDFLCDIAFMASRWGRGPMRAGLNIATNADGRAAASDAKRAATKTIERAEWRSRCVDALNVTDTRTLPPGCRLIVANKRCSEWMGLSSERCTTAAGSQRVATRVEGCPSLRRRGGGGSGQGDVRERA